MEGTAVPGRKEAGTAWVCGKPRAAVASRRKAGWCWGEGRGGWNVGGEGVLTASTRMQRGEGPRVPTDGLGILS